MVCDGGSSGGMEWKQWWYRMEAVVVWNGSSGGIEWKQWWYGMEAVVV